MPLFAIGELNTLPPDVLDQITAMQKAIDKLTADFASVNTCNTCYIMYYRCTSTLLLQLSSQMGSSSEERSRLEELGSEVAQLRERMSEVDRAVTALTNTGIHEHVNRTDDANKFLWVSLPL